MPAKDFRFAALAPVPVLLIPLFGNLFVDGWDWDAGSFVFAWVILATAAFTYRRLATAKTATLAYRTGVGLAVVASFVLFWVNLAVGLIGSEDNPANALYFLVILVGLIGVFAARFEARGLAHAAFAMAFGTFLVPVIALLAWRSDFTPGFASVFSLNSFFVAVFFASGLLLRHAATQPSLQKAA